MFDVKLQITSKKKDWGMAKIKHLQQICFVKHNPKMIF